MTTADVEAQMAEILDEVRQAPLLSAQERVDAPECTLRVEFANDEVIMSQINDLVERWPETHNQLSVAVRYARRDGNCFYRCSAFSLLRLMIHSAKFARDCRAQMDKWKPILLAQFGQYSKDFHDIVYEQVEPLCNEHHSITEDDVLRFLTCDEAPYAIVYLRYLVSLYIRSEADFFLPFIMAQDYTTVEAYCESEVEPVDHVSDDTQLVALANLFNVRIEVYAIDRTAGARVTRHLFREEAPADQCISLLFRPGHYDLLLPC